MGYLQMQLMNETTETSTIGICLNIDKFYADLDFTANSDFEKWDEYPFERFHERMRNFRRNVILEYYILLQLYCHG